MAVRTEAPSSPGQDQQVATRRAYKPLRLETTPISYTVTGGDDTTVATGMRTSASGQAQITRLADRAYVLETGGIVLEGPSDDLGADPRVRATYLGGGPGSGISEAAM